MEQNLKNSIYDIKVVDLDYGFADTLHIEQTNPK